MDRTLTVSPSELNGFRVWKLPPTTPDDFIPEELEEYDYALTAIEDTKGVSDCAISHGDLVLGLLVEARSPDGWRYLFPIENLKELESFEDNLEDLRREIERGA